MTAADFALFGLDLQPTGLQQAQDFMAKVETPSDEIDRQVIDQAIRHFAGTYRPFSANDLRSVLPSVRKSLIAPAIISAARKGLIQACGEVRSTDVGTHGKKLTLWVGVPQQRENPATARETSVDSATADGPVGAEAARLTHTSNLDGRGLR